MKPNQEIKKKLIQGANRNKIDFEIELDNYIEAIKSARSVEKIMIAKQTLIINMITSLPLGVANCYFCLESYSSCTDCQWAKYHKDCCKPNGDYRRIQNLRSQLTVAIRECYYRGEKYKNVKETNQFKGKEKIKKVSSEWIKEYNIKILDPDGWDRKNYDYSFNQEKIDRQEFERRLVHSTIQGSIRGIIYKDKLSKKEDKK